MRSAASGPNICVMTKATRELVLEVDPGAGPLTGRIRDRSGATLPFAGWLSFASALGQALEHDPGEPRRRATNEREDERPVAHPVSGRTP